MDNSEILRHLTCTRSGCICEHVPDRGRGLVHCPAHDDKNPSLSITIEGGKLLFSCKAGCTQDAILAALKERGWWGDRPRERASLKIRGRQIRCTRYELRDATADLVAVHVRRDFEKGAKKMHWESPDGVPNLGGRRVSSLPLYGTELLKDAPADAKVIVVEGEKSSDAGRRFHRLTLATVTGAASTPDEKVLEVLRGHPVWLWPDNDDISRQHFERIAAVLIRMGCSVKLVVWPDAPPKADLADYLDYGLHGGEWSQNGGGRGREDLQELLREAKPWSVPTGLGMSLRSIGTSPKTNILTFPDIGEVRLSTPHLMRWNLVRIQCWEQCNALPAAQPRNQTQWENLLDQLVEQAPDPEAAPGFSPLDETGDLILDFLQTAQRLVPETASARGPRPWLDGDRIIFRLRQVRSFFLHVGKVIDNQTLHQALQGLHMREEPGLHIGKSTLAGARVIALSDLPEDFEIPGHDPKEAEDDDESDQ